jgi:hypothetical protein
MVVWPFALVPVLLEVGVRPSVATLLDTPDPLLPCVPTAGSDPLVVPDVVIVGLTVLFFIKKSTNIIMAAATMMPMVM